MSVPEKEIQYLHYSYEQMVEDLRRVVNMVKKTNWKPDLIVGLTRGGLIPAVMLSHKYDVPLVPINLSLRDFKSDYNSVLVDLNQATPRYFNGKYKNILVVDDILDSGDTLDELSRIFKVMDFDTQLDIKYATLFYNVTNEKKFVPDFYGQTINKQINAPWIIFNFENALEK